MRSADERRGGTPAAPDTTQHASPAPGGPDLGDAEVRAPLWRAGNAPELSDVRVHAPKAADRPARLRAPLAEPLTPREVQVLEMVARGWTNRKIAAELVLSVGTVRVHVQHILRKLGVADRTGAAVRAVETGLIVLPGGPTAVPP